MPVNTLGALDKQALELALDELKTQLFNIPMCTNNKYSRVPAGMRSTLEVPVPLPMGKPYNITPGHQPKEANAYATAERQIVLDQWIGQDFSLTDLESHESGMRSLPMAMKSAVISLSNQVAEHYMRELRENTYGSFGAANTIPFADKSVRPFTQSKKILKQQLCPMERGALIAFLSDDAEAEAMELEVFQRHDWNGGSSVANTGALPSDPFGFKLFTPQVPATHVAGDAANYLVNRAGGIPTDPVLTEDGVENYEVAVDGGTGDFNVGDIFNFAGDPFNYVVRGWNNATNVLAFSPRPRVAIADNATVTVKYGDHDCNFLLHKDAMAFATRPMAEDVTPGIENIVSMGTLGDERSGLILTMENKRQNNQTRRELRIFYGMKMIRHEFGMRLIQQA